MTCNTSDGACFDCIFNSQRVANFQFLVLYDAVQLYIKGELEAVKEKKILQEDCYFPCRVWGCNIE